MLSTVIQVSALLLVATFAWAGLAKAFRWRRWRAALSRYRLGPTLERAALLGVPATELAVVVLFVMGEVRIGAALVVALVSAFSIAVVRARGLEGDKLPCGCFGASHSRDYKEMLIRNALLAALAAGVLLLARVGGAGASAPPARAEIVPALLVAIGIGVGAWVLWQVGTSLRRRA
jgi:hypothetical protein